MRLWVDDIRHAPDNSWMVARTVTTAINAIAQFGAQFTEISLDHDISHQIEMAGMSRPFACSETFTPVAWFVAFYYQDGKLPKITVHTANPEGAQKMKTIIQSQHKQDAVRVAPMSAANRLEMEL